MINDDICIYRSDRCARCHQFAGIIFHDATLREPKAANLARVHPRSKVQAVAADNPSPYARVRNTDTDKLPSLELVNLDYHPRHTAPSRRCAR